MGIEPVLVFDQLPPRKKVAMLDCKSPDAFLGRRYVKDVILQALDKENISYIVAPHESDSQLQHLMHTNCIYAVLSNDSYMIFRRISRVIYEWDPNPPPNAVGNCFYFKLTSLERDLERENISFSSFQQGCLLLGTDYNPPIQKLGSNGNHFNFKYDEVLTLVKNHRNLLNVVRYEPTLRFEPMEVVGLDRTKDVQISKRRKLNATKFSGNILQVLRIATISAFCQSIYDEKEGNVLSVNYARPMLRGITEGVTNLISVQEMIESFAENERVIYVGENFDKIIDDEYQICRTLDSVLINLDRIRNMSQLEDLYTYLEMLPEIIITNFGGKYFLQLDGARRVKDAMTICCKDTDLIRMMRILVKFAKKDKDLKDAFIGMGYYSFFLRMILSSSNSIEGYQLLATFLMRDDMRFHKEPSVAVEGLCGCELLKRLGVCVYINAGHSSINETAASIVAHLKNVHEIEGGNGDADSAEFANGFISLQMEAMQLIQGD